MPNQVTNTVQQNNNSIYSNMDEMLAKPPSSIVRYGSITMLLLLLILCSISFFVNYEDGVTGVAHIQADNKAEIKSPLQNVIVEKNFIQKDTIVQKGDSIMSIKANNNIETITAPIAGKITCQRKLQQGDALDANILLFTMVGTQNEFKIKIILPEADADKIILGQNIKITLPGYPPSEYGVVTGEIISLPYIDSTSKKITIDAVVRFTTSNNSEKVIPYISNTTASAYIVTAHKSLAAAFVGL
jgi:multidrug efflux pump subunit AcrA (membrane-fusion protein)